MATFAEYTQQYMRDKKKKETSPSGKSFSEYTREMLDSDTEHTAHKAPSPSGVNLSEREQLQSDLTQKRKAQQEYTEGEGDIGFWDAILPGGATPSEYKESRQKKKQYEKEVQEAAAQVAAYEQFWKQQKVAGKTSAEIDAYLDEGDAQIERLKEDKVGFFEAMKPGGVKPSERKTIKDEKEAEIKKIESQQGMYRAVRDEKKSREMTDSLPEDVKKLLDEYNGIGDTTQANQIAAIFAPESSMMYHSANYEGTVRKQEIAEELTRMGYGNYAELAEYRQYVNDVEGARKAEEEISAFAKEHPVASSAMSVVLSPAGNIAGSIGTAENVLRDKESDLGANPYDSWYFLDAAKNATRQAVPETFEDGMLSAKTKGMLYNTAMSGADSALAGLTMGGAGGIMLGAGALNDTYTDVLKRGGTQEQALMSGILAGTAEGVFEAVSLGMFVKGADVKDVSSFIKNMLVQAGVNAQEEATTELVNILADYYVNGGISDYYQNYEYALRTGMSEEEAKAYAKKISAEQIGEAALSGALMGTAFGAVGSGTGIAGYNAQLRNVGKNVTAQGDVDYMLAVADDVQGNDKLMQLAKEIEASEQARASDGDKKRTGKELRNIGRLVKATDDATNQDIDKLAETAIRERLTRVKETGDVDVIARAIVKKITEKKLSHREAKALKESKKATQVYREAIGEFYDAEWSRKLDSDIHALYERRYEPDIEAYRAGKKGEPSPSLRDTSPEGRGKEGSAFEGDKVDKVEGDNAEKVKEQFKEKLIQDGQDAEIFDAGFELYYEQGRSGGYEFTKIKDNTNVSESFTEYQRQQAFELGVHHKLKDVGNAKYKGGTVDVFVNGYTRKNTVNSYAKAFDVFYAEGVHTKKSFEAVMKEQKSLLKFIDESVARKAFEEGRKQSTSAQRSDEKQIKRTPKKDGSYVSKTIEEGEIDTFLEAFSKKLGLDTVRVQKIINGEDEANAQIDLKSGKMVSSASSRNEYQSTIHESVHLAYAYGDTKKMAEIETSMKDYFTHLHGAASFENVIRQYAEAYTDLDRAGVMEEFTADALAGVFSTDEGVNEFLNWLQNESGYSQAEKKTILEKLSEWLLEIIDKIRELVEEGHLNNVTEAYAKAQAEQFTEVREKFIEVLDEIEGVEGAEGVKRSFAGLKAKTGNVGTLEQAQKLEDVGKATAEEIRQQTGWFRGMDGKWRFEISDRDMEVDTTGKFHSNPDVRRYQELFDKAFVSMDATETEMTELRNLDKVLKGVNMSPRTLGELIKHDKLFSAYPQLKDTSVHFADIDENGIYDPISKIIVINSKLKLNKSKLEKTLIHEIQHAVQDIEGFSSGSSPDYWQMNGATKEEAYDLYERTAGEIEARDAASRYWRSEDAIKEKRPDIDRTDVVFADGGVSWTSAKKAKYDPEIASISEQIRNSQSVLNSMDIVGEATTPKTFKDKYEAGQWAITQLKAFGYQVDRQNFGKIYFGESDIKDGINYADTNAEKAALILIPKVLKRGIEIGHHGNHKLRQKETITFAGPVILNGIRGNMAVVVNMHGNKYSVHRILLPDGSSFKFSEKNNEVKQESYQGVTVKSSLADTTSFTSDNSIPDSTENVNDSTKNSLKQSLDWVDFDADDLGAENRSLAKKNTELEKINEELRAQIRHPGVKHIVSQLGVQKVARHLKSEYMSKINIHKLAGELCDFYTLIANGDGISWDSLQIHIERIADMILNESKYMNPDISDYAKGVLRDIRSVKIKLNDAQKSEVASEYGSYNNFRKRTMGTLVLSNEGMSLDERWGELSEAYPHFFPEDTADTDQPRVLMEAVASLRETYEDMNGMDLASARDMLMTEIYEQYFEVPETKYISEEYKLKYAKAKADFGEKLREAKADFKKQRDEAYNAVREKYYLRAPQYDDALDALVWYEMRMRKADEAKVKERKRKRLIKSLKRLDKLLRSPGKGAPSTGVNKYGQNYVHLTNIPEDFKKAVIDFCDIFIKHDAGVFTGKYKDSDDVVHEKIAELYDQYQLLKGSKTYLEGSVDADIAKMIHRTRQIVAYKRISQLSVYELGVINDFTDHLLTVINNQVEMWVDGKKHKVEGLGSTAVDQLTAKGQYKHIDSKAHDFIKNWGVNNMKPIYFFERVGGVLEKLYLEIQNKGQRDYARNITAAAAFMDEAGKKFGFDKWADEEDLTLKTTQGHTIKLTKAQAMHIWATAKREVIAGKDSRHIMQGGIVFENEVEADFDEKDKSEKNKLSSKVWKYKKADGSAHRISLDDLDKISAYLTDEQKKFVDTMVGYLSNDMAALGNEVSMELYGIRRFNEKYYIPFNSAKNFIYRSMGEQGEAMLRSESFTKETAWGANNPLVVGDFMEVVAGHIERMAMYNAMVIPLENFSKIWNYKTFAPEQEGAESAKSVRSAMETAYGKSYVSYVDTLLKDINGGINADSREKSIGRLLSNFKKTAVLGSASVVIQQPSAVVRAFAEIDPSYFVTTTFAGRKKAWEKALKYSSTALLKDIGGFDTVSGRGTTDWLTKTEYKGKDKVLKFFSDSQYRDDILAWGPSFADKVTWAHIWAACEKEVASKNKGLQGEELYKKTGERFDEVINKTQVYDSVLSRSAHMRSKSNTMQIITSFMSEPTTQANMIASAFHNAKNGDKSKAAKQIASVVTAILFNSVLVSAIYAARDDDEEKTLIEKYIAEIAENFLGSLNPLTMIPLFKDIWSMLEGYDIERSDMSVYADIIDSLKAWNSDKKTLPQKIWGTVGSISNAFGFPLKNIIREGYAVKNITQGITSISDTTGKGILYALEESAFPVLQTFKVWKPSTKDERLYAAFSEGDKKMYNRIATQYTSGGSIKSALKKQIGERFVEGDIDEQTAISQFRKLGLTENEAYYEVRSLKDPLPEEESEDTNADFFDFDSMQNVQGNADAESGEAKGDYDWLENALATGDRSDIQKEINDLKKRGVSEDDINSKIKSWIKVNDSTVAAEAERYKQGNLNSFESTVKSIASKYGVDESSVAGAIRSAAGDKSKAIEGTIYAYGDLHTSIGSVNTAQTQNIASSIINAKTEGYLSEGMTRAEAQKKAKQSVRSSLTSEWKPIYIAASSTERTRIRQQLYATGAYDSVSHLDDILKGWREGN